MSSFSLILRFKKRFEGEKRNRKYSKSWKQIIKPSTELCYGRDMTTNRFSTRDSPTHMHGENIYSAGAVKQRPMVIEVTWSNTKLICICHVFGAETIFPTSPRSWVAFKIHFIPYNHSSLGMRNLSVVSQIEHDVLCCTVVYYNGRKMI